LPKDHTATGRLDELAGAFQQPESFLQKVADLIRHHRTWRGELLLRDEGNREKPLMVRADPVQPSRDRTLGFVLIFSDIADRKAAEAARSRFQEGIIQSNRINSVRLDSKTDLVYQNLLSSVVENAQLAAFEITYGVETGRIAEMLESVRNSTLRTAEVLEHLIWHSSRTSGGKKSEK
jgi:hypothetical protein